MTNTTSSAWRAFNGGNWQKTIDVRDFIQKNYTPYEAGADFLSGPTERTRRVMSAFEEKCRLERERGGVIGIDNKTVSSLNTYPAAYLLKEDELIVGLQTG